MRTFLAGPHLAARSLPPFLGLEGSRLETRPCLLVGVLSSALLGTFLASMTVPEYTLILTNSSVRN